MVPAESLSESQRDSAAKLRVARNKLPGESQGRQFHIHPLFMTALHLGRNLVEVVSLSIVYPR